MCLAIPSRIVDIENHMAVIDVDGVQRKVSLLLVENPQVGDWVIVHAGFAIQIIDEEVARESLQIMRETLAFVEGRSSVEDREP